MVNQQDFIALSERAKAIKNPDVFWDFSQNALADCGVSGFGYGVLPLTMDSALNGFGKAGFFRHTYPGEWDTDHSVSTLEQDELTIELVINGTSEVIWSDQSLLSQANADQRQQWDLESDIGMQFGASFALDRNARGQPISGIGLWAGDPQTEQEFASYWRDYRSALYRICHMIDEGLRGDHAQLLVNLTTREQDCLTYLAIGMRPAEICWRLKISERTFEKYIKGAKDKLRANTRDHAIAKALLLNVIRP